VQLAELQLRRPSDLLAGHSQRKTQRVVPVEYTRRKYRYQPARPIAKVENPFQSYQHRLWTPEDERLGGNHSIAPRSRRPTFFTHDLGFFDPVLCHKDYSVVCLDVNAKETAVYIRRFLRHPGFRTQKQRLGKVILARQRNLSFWEIGNQELQRLGWPKP